MPTDHRTDNRSSKDEEEPSPWGNVVLVTAGVVLMLLPLVAIFIGVNSIMDVLTISNAQDQPFDSPTTGMLFSFVFGIGCVLKGVADLRQSPPQYRLRTLLIVTAVVAAALGFAVLAARN